MKAKIESQCPQTDSCADIFAFAARDSVFRAGGIRYAIPSGRQDGRVSLSSEVIRNPPDSSFNVKQLRENFARKGLSLEVTVFLSGAHSIGDSRCSSFSNRLYSFNSTHQQDPSLDPKYAKYLNNQCPRPNLTTLDPVVPFDNVTPYRLDNHYYIYLKKNKGLLMSDQALWNHRITKKMVKNNVNHPMGWASSSELRWCIWV